MKKYKYIIKKEIKRNPMRFINKIIISDFNVTLTLHNFDVVDTLEGLLNILTENNLQSIELFQLDKPETNSILETVKDYIEYIEIFDCECDYLLLEKVENLKMFKGLCLKSLTKLWNISKNKYIEQLILFDCGNIHDISGLKDSLLKTIEFKKDYALNPSPLSIKNLDLNVFSTLKNLESLTLHILKSDDVKKDLIALSKLTSLDELNLTKNYFTFKEFAFLKSRLTNVKGIDCVYHLGKDPSNERVYAIIIGEDKPDLIYLDDEDIGKYQEEYNKLIELYKNS